MKFFSKKRKSKNFNCFTIYLFFFYSYIDRKWKGERKIKPFQWSFWKNFSTVLHILDTLYASPLVFSVPGFVIPMPIIFRNDKISPVSKVKKQFLSSLITRLQKLETFSLEWFLYTLAVILLLKLRTKLPSLT